jgi:hypothetical protein
MDAYIRNESVDNYFGIIEKNIYEDFLVNLRKAVDSGLSLYVTNAQLAIDLGIVDRVEPIEKLSESGNDLRSLELIGPQSTGGRRQYLDSHINNALVIRNTLDKLTSWPSYIHKEYAVWIEDDALNFGGSGKLYQKYDWKPNGLGVGDTFLFSDINIETEAWPFYQAAPISSIKAGKAITTFAPTYFNGNVEVENPYKDHAVHIAVEPGTVLKGKQLGGKIFVSFTEGFPGSQGYLNSRNYNNPVTEHGIVELTTDFWINRAYDTGYIDLARKNYLLNYDGNLDRQIEDQEDPNIVERINRIKYWSTWGDNIVAQQQLNISEIIMGPGTSTGTNASNKAVADGATGAFTGWRQEQFFTFKYSRRYPTMVIDTPPMTTRGFWWLADRVFIDGQVQRPLAFESIAQMLDPTIVTTKILLQSATPMIANATIKEAQGYVPQSINILSLPLEASARINEPARIYLAQPFIAASEMRQNHSIITSSTDEVVLYIHNVDPVLYLREEIIK